MANNNEIQSKGGYNPIPSRVWSRVQADCVYVDPGSNYNSVYIPLTNQTVSLAQADYEAKQFYKGNILQYKGNSAQLTKKQKYSQLARCAGPSRTKVFATQSQRGYTNPNTTAMKRVGYTTYTFPNQIVNAPNNISGPFTYNIPNPFGCANGNAVQDGGVLICGSLENPCSGEVYKEGPQNATVCFPASASNVPGSSFLCWNNKIQTWFPRQRYFMNNSADKWPEGYKGFTSAFHPDSPVLTLKNVNGQDATITWSNNNTCLVPYEYTIYLNDSFYNSISFQIKEYTFINLPLGDNSIYMTSTAYPNFKSNPSNTIIVTITSSTFIVTK
jgi:hypothetical protein